MSGHVSTKKMGSLRKCGSLSYIWKAVEFGVLLLVFLWEFDNEYGMIKTKYRIRTNRNGG